MAWSYGCRAQFSVVVNGGIRVLGLTTVMGAIRGIIGFDGASIWSTSPLCLPVREVLRNWSIQSYLALSRC